MFKILYGKGFHITFPNGLTLSTQFGTGNYCEHHIENLNNVLKQSLTPAGELIVESNDCEIAIWYKNKIWITKLAHKEIFGEDLGDDVDGYLRIEEWLKYFDWARNQKGESDE